MSRESYNPNKEEIYTIKEDVSMPGVHKGQTVSGVSSSLNFTKTALGHPKVRYKDRIMEMDVYRSGEGGYLIHSYCPSCQNAVSIKSENKKIDYDPITNNLNIEAFECPWEKSDELLGSSRKFGFSLCRLKIAIDNNIAKDA